MKSPLILLVLVGLSCASNSPAFRDNTQYIYQIYGKTLTSLHELSHQFAGIYLKAKLHISACPNGKLEAKILNAQYAQIHSNLPNGWDTSIPESGLNYKPLPLSETPIHIVVEDGLINSLIVDSKMSNWEANIVKSILSQFQLDLKGQNAIPSPMNKLPKENGLDGVFKTMEESITGETETIYHTHRFPEYLVQNQPWLVPKLQLMGDGQIYEVIKNRNYSNSKKSPSYHFGFGNVLEGYPTANRMGKFYSRQSNSRVILTGKLSRYTIQHVRSVNKIIINPSLNAKERGSVISAFNVTLYEVNTPKEECEELKNPTDIGSLVYTYESPFSAYNYVYRKQEGPNYVDYSSEESSEKFYQKVRRYAGPLIRKLQDEDSSNSSSEEQMQYQSRPVLNRAPAAPLLPYYTGYYGQSINASHELDIKQSIKRIAKEISEELQQPEKVLSYSTLSKYVMLCSLIRLLDVEDIKSLTDELYSESKEGKEYFAWVAFRDSVAQAGTGPSFLSIENWIETGIIKEGVASDVVAAMANAVRVPTEEYMRNFFELVRKPKVINQQYLNETALFAYTNLVYKVYINKNQSHNEYPVHSFRNFYTKEGKEFVKSTVIPYLSQQLHDAISQADSRKIHAYILALGNTGHKKILNTYQPYLEGKQQVSQFQRMLMVLSFNKLVESYPEVASIVLYKIYQNTAEIPEVRVVAVHQFMRTNPPVEMVQRMAENTNIDPQEQVNAAVKSVIESASKLQSAESHKLRESAKSARPLLNKEEYGQHQSLNFLSQYVTENMDYELHHSLLQVGSSDSSLPKGVKYETSENMNGMRFDRLNIQAMISSIKELTNVFYKQTAEYQEAHNRAQRQTQNSPWSSAKIAEILKLETNEREQLEGFIHTQMEHIHQFWSFDNQTIEQLPQIIHEKEEKLRKGEDFLEVKLRKLRELILSLPTEMGLPFVYTYDNPLYVHFQGKMKAVATPELSKHNRLNMPKQISAEVDVFVTVSSKVQSHISVVTPFDHHMYAAGFDKNVQVHLPIKASVAVDVENEQAKIEYEIKEMHKDAQLLHYSSWPFTSEINLIKLNPIALSPNTHLIKPQPNTHTSFDFSFGKTETGINFRIWGHHQQQSKNLMELLAILQSGDIPTIWQQLWDEGSMHQSEINISLDPDQTTSRKIVINLSHVGEYKKKPEVPNEERIYNMEELSSIVQQNTEPRQQEMLKYVGSGIKSAKLHSFDASFEFQGERKYNHIMTMAYAKSNVGPQSRFVYFYRRAIQKPLELVVQLKGHIPNTNEMDFAYSLENEPSAKYEIYVESGENDQKSAKINATISLMRSLERKQYIKRQPLSQVCKAQMKEGNRQLPACQNMTIESNYFDDMRVDLNYDNMKKEWVNYTENIYKAVRFIYYPMTEIQSISSMDQNKINLTVQFEPESLRQVNFTVQVQDEETKIFNVSISEMSKTILVQHPMYHVKARFLGKIMAQQNIRPTCVIDKKAASTFNNVTYPVSLGKDWTLMMLYMPLVARPTEEGRKTPVEQLVKQRDNFAVLVRELSAEQREVMVTIAKPKKPSETVEVTMKAKKQGSKPSASVFVDGKEVQFNEKQAFEMYDGYLEIYALPNGEVKLEIRSWFYLIFDGERVKIVATSDKLRDSAVGLCGRFSDDRYEDFWTPKNCIVGSAKKFVQNFVVKHGQEGSQPHYQECVSKVMPLYVDVISNYNVQTSELVDEQNLSEVKLRNRYVEENGEICFTLHPVPVCEQLSRASITKDVPVHCVNNTKTAYYLKNQIDQGGNPDFSHKPETKKIQMEIPKDCY